MGSELRILIADDHPVFRRGLREVIDGAGLKVIDEAEDGSEALEKIRALQPEVAILDVHMPKMGGFDLVRALRGSRIATAIIFLTMYKDEEIFNSAMDLGVKGYVLKDGAIAEIIVKMGLKKLPLLPARHTTHLMAKAAVMVYEAAVEQIRIPSWKASVTRKQTMLGDIYGWLKGEVDTARSLTLEVMIVGLIVLELLVAAGSLFHR